jgi:hypothetical protein
MPKHHLLRPQLFRCRAKREIAANSAAFVIQGIAAEQQASAMQLVIDADRQGIVGICARTAVQVVAGSTR